MNIWHISDTHGYHEKLEIPKNIDVVIHSGDATNHRSPALNEVEMIRFIQWFSRLPIKTKIYVAGNHDTSIEAGLITIKNFEEECIYYLHNTSMLVGNLLVYGSPYTPTFNDWAFNIQRHKMQKVWNNIPENVDILITHTPPKGILDLTENRDHTLERCGCASLRNIINFREPVLSMFGHIHNCTDIINAGVFKKSNSKTIYSNASVVTDNKFGTLSSHGNIFSVNKYKKVVIK